MDADRLRTFLHTLPHVVETVQWGGSLVFWVGDKAIGGKIFTVIRLEPEEKNPRVISYAAGPEHSAELLETEGIIPAPYLARAHWVAVESWNVFRPAQWQSELQAAYAYIYAKLPPRTRAVLALPPAQQKKLLRERKALLASRAER